MRKIMDTTNEKRFWSHSSDRKVVNDFVFDGDTNSVLWRETIDRFLNYSELTIEMTEWDYINTYYPFYNKLREMVYTYTSFDIELMENMIPFDEIIYHLDRYVKNREGIAIEELIKITDMYKHLVKKNFVVNSYSIFNGYKYYYKFIEKEKLDSLIKSILDFLLYYEEYNKIDFIVNVISHFYYYCSDYDYNKEILEILSSYLSNYKERKEICLALNYINNDYHILLQFFPKKDRIKIEMEMKLGDD
jgi:hypothetical protein